MANMSSKKYRHSENFGGRVKQVRKEKNLTQNEFARLLGTSAGYVSEIETGKKVPGSEFLVSLRRVFSTNINWLLTGEGPLTLEINSSFEEALDWYSDSELRKIIDFLTKNPGIKKYFTDHIKILRYLSDKPWEKKTFCEIMQAINDRFISKEKIK